MIQSSWQAEGERLTAELDVSGADLGLKGRLQGLKQLPSSSC